MVVGRFRPGVRGLLGAGALGLAVLGGGCSTTVSDIGLFSSDPPPCPAAGTLIDAATVTEFAGNSTAQSNVRYRAEITRSAFDCSVSGNAVDGTVALIGEVSLGRRGRAGEISLPIFVAVTLRDKEVVSKRFDTIELTVDRGQTRANFEKVIQDFSFNVGSGRKTADYEILVGFNLTPEQVVYNRKQLDGN